MGITKKISDELNVSKATVSRALNNCYGIDFATKEKIVELALKYGYRRYKSAQAGIIMPHVPTTFWKMFSNKMGNHLENIGLDCRVFTYSGLFCEEDALLCIKDAFDSDVSILIVALPDTPKIEKALLEYSDKMLIISVNEILDVNNSFYVGDNHFKSGYELFSEYIKKYPNKNRALVILNEFKTKTQTKRLEGFIKALEENSGILVKTVTIPYSKTIMPSFIARELKGIKNDEIDCIFSSEGTLISTCSAISKLGFENVDCIGFENMLENTKYIDMGIIKAVVEQNISSQIEVTTRLVNAYSNTLSYPDKKYTYTKNNLKIF